MSLSSNNRSVPSRFVLTAVLLLVAANGCGKKEATTTTPLQATQPSAGVVSAEKTSFTDVTAQLDPGGSLYAYLSTSQWLEGLSGRINGWRDAVLSLPTLGTEERSNVTKAFDKGLKTTAEFKRLAQGMPSEGNAFSFVSQRLSDIVQQIQKSALSQMPGQGNEMPTVLMQKISSLNQPVSSFVVSRSTTQGWLTVGHGTQQPANAIVLPLVVAPTAILAGLTLPALAKAKGKSQSIVCINNLKQMGLGARIYATDHNGIFPPSFLAMKNELSTPKILICPSDSNHAVSATLTWASFHPSQSSYEFVTRGLTESTPGVETKVLFRCKVHGHECMGDGRVEQKNSGTR